MAWVEQTGRDTWRVRYRRDDGRIGSVSGFGSEADAAAYVADMATDRRRGDWIDPALGRMTVADWAQRWFASLALDPRTVESYNPKTRSGPSKPFGETPPARIHPPQNPPDGNHRSGHANSPATRPRNSSPPTKPGQPCTSSASGSASNAGPSAPSSTATTSPCAAAASTPNKSTTPSTSTTSAGDSPASPTA